MLFSKKEKSKTSTPPKKESVTLGPLGSLQGELVIPGDKSVSHRSVIFGGLALGESSFENFLTSADCLSTLKAFQHMGIVSKLEWLDRGSDGLVRGLTMYGGGLSGLKPPKPDLDMGNSGTSTRLLLGVVAAQPFKVRMFGDESLSKRPMDRVVEPLRQMGAEIAGRENGKYLPIEVTGHPLRGIRYELPVASAQVKSCLMLAGLFAEGETEIIEKVPSRNHTEIAMKTFQADYRNHAGTLRHIVRKGELKPASYFIPGDISSAAFFIVGALIAKDSNVVLKRVGLNPTRTGLLEVLKRMGASIQIENRVEVGEPYGDLVIKSASLKGIKLDDPRIIPAIIDEIPILTLACAVAEGVSEIRGVGELRVKESDRIAVMVKNLVQIGARVEELEDGFRIHGTGGAPLEGGVIDSRGDHRVAMTFALASLVTKNPVTIQDIACVPTSYPEFFEDFKKLKHS